jgi:hypothetical protein
MAAHVLAGTNHPTGPHKFSVVLDACAAPGNKASPELLFCSRSTRQVLNPRVVLFSFRIVVLFSFSIILSAIYYKYKKKKS